jgi:hypothetical protein
MEALKVRKSDKGVKLALTAIDSTAAETAKSGYRLLRECAGPDEAEVLVAKLMKERHSRSTLVQEAIAGAAKRDTTGTYVKLLEDAWPNAKSQDQKLSLLGAFGRVSDSKLLPLAESALKDSDSEVSTAAVRALAAWSNNDSINNLMSIAYTSDDSKQRILAQRGIEKKLEAKGVDKAPFKKEWEKVSSGAGDADIKKKLNDFFSK